MAYGYNADLENLMKGMQKGNNSFGASGFGNMSFGGNSQPSSQSASNMNMQKAEGGGMGKINPLSMAMNAASGALNIAQAVTAPKFDYGQANYTVQQAGQAEGERAKGIANAAGSAIPVVGGLLGGIFGMIGQKIAQNRGEAKARTILDNRQDHISNLEQFQMSKIKDNNFLKSSDLYKNMFNENQNF